MLTDEKGNIASCEVVTVKKTVSADGNTTTAKEKTYLAKKAGVTAKSIKSGDSYFAGTDGKIITSALFTVNSTKKGQLKVTINEKGFRPAFTVFIDDPMIVSSFKGEALLNGSGEQYYAKKSGKLAKDKWVKVGLKEYYCGSDGKVAKVKDAK
ncbi:MAG: hypothetical protein K5853_04350 [Lachnospiraceae bacterium]|nr:hypothetical protein [Lachnospiraceae bacterium]